jgi:predicted MFS family arabinose efflux permease
MVGALGWRPSLVLIGLLPLLVGAPLALWGFPPAPAGPAVQPEPERENESERRSGLSFVRALGSRAFWVLVLVFTPAAFAAGAPIPNLENILLTAHLAPRTIIALSAALGPAIIVGRIAGGALLDRLWAPLVGSAVLLLSASGCLLLAEPAVPAWRAFAALTLIGFGAGVEADLLAFLVARYLGLYRYSAIYGVLFGLFATGASVGPSLLAYGYGRLGGYGEPLLICALLLVFAALALPGLGRYPGPDGRRTRSAGARRRPAAFAG